ncbi:MAG: hypothetical protein JSU90_07920 [Nitrospiraceae bacterium]|nr:MAG: hypothetical protein JSU90_07920 [Nitrospiraceae bacterium]
MNEKKVHVFWENLIRKGDYGKTFRHVQQQQAEKRAEATEKTGREKTETSKEHR